MKKTNAKKIKFSVVALALVMCLGIAGVSAYFTDGDTATNEFTIGKVSIDLQEPSFDETNAINLTPDQEIAKDPKILNDGINDAYVFLEVVVPCANVQTAAEGGAYVDAAKTELFDWTVNEGWVQVEVEEEDAQNTYVYAWVGTGDDASDDKMAALAADAETGTLFDYVRFANVTENAGLEESEQEITVNAYAIQTQNLNDGEAGDVSVDGDNTGKTAPADVWAIVETQLPSTDYTGEDVSTDVKPAA